MTKSDQIEFVEALTRNVRDEIVAQIDDDKIPTAWDGHELRMLLFETFQSAASISLLYKDRRSSRARSYRNEVARLW